MRILTFIILSIILSSFESEVETIIDKEVKMKKIRKVHQAEYSKIEDLITYRALPTRSVGMDNIEPFIFLNHHGPQVYARNNNGLPFGPHPHKGFETVTFIVKGDILHKDTKGHESIITEGGIQWMTAGSGVVHSEVSSKEFKEKGGDLEILQLWINLPARLKSAAPKYIGLQKNEIPVVSEDSGKVKINLISGKYKNSTAPIQSISDVFMSTVNFEKSGKLNVNIDSSLSVFLYIVQGSLKINNTLVQQRNLIEFFQEGEKIEMEAMEKSLIIFGHAKPNREPIVAKGPFVMNTNEEIQQAWKEYYDGKFGSLE